MLRLKKSLGQNFLTDNNIIKKIISLDNLKNQTILEIGPGSGNLTEFIIKEQPSIETIIGGVVIILTIATHSFLALKKPY